MSAAQEDFIRDTTAEVSLEIGLKELPPVPCCTPNCQNLSAANETWGLIKWFLNCVNDMQAQLNEEFTEGTKDIYQEIRIPISGTFFPRNVL